MKYQKMRKKSVNIPVIVARPRAVQSLETSLLFGHFAEVQQAVHVVKMTQCPGKKKMRLHFYLTFS